MREVTYIVTTTRDDGERVSSGYEYFDTVEAARSYAKSWKSRQDCWTSSVLIWAATEVKP